MTVDVEEEPSPSTPYAPYGYIPTQEPSPSTPYAPYGYIPTQESAFSYQTSMPPPDFNATPASTSRGYTPTQTGDIPTRESTFFVPKTGAPI